MTEQAERVTAVPRRVGEARRWPRSFADRLTDPLPRTRDILRVSLRGGFRPRGNALSALSRLPVERSGVPEPGLGQTSVTWAGHASWVIRTAGRTVLTDPVWSRRILGTPPRVTPVGVDWDDLPEIDAVLISHNHYDHLDLPTLKRLPRHTALFVPAGLGMWFRRRGFTCVTDLDWWECAELHGVRFDFVPAHHWSKRGLTDTCRSLWGGWLITEPGGLRVYFGGDTGYGRWFTEIGRRYQDIDLAILPVGAYEPRWLLRPVHADPEEAVRACLDLGAPRLAPMHYGTFLLSGEPVLQPLERVRAAWKAAGMPYGDLWDLPIGGSRLLDRPGEPGGEARAAGPR